MNEITIKVGDTFIIHTKYGGVITDTIAEVAEHYVVDSDAKALVVRWVIRSSKGIWYDLKDIEVVSRLLSDEEKDQIDRLYTALEKAKNQKKEKHKRIVEEYKNRKSNER